MKRKSFMLIGMALSCFILSISMVRTAHAYLDPGTGSVILQGVLAAIVAIGLTAKLYWHRLLKLLRIRKVNGNDKKDLT